jgi:hypothetical protein
MANLRLIYQDGLADIGGTSNNDIRQHVEERSTSSSPHVLVRDSGRSWDVFINVQCLPEQERSGWA